MAEDYGTPAEVSPTRRDPKDLYPTAAHAEKENARRTRKQNTRQKALLDQALERFRMASEGGENNQRLRELDDLKFDRGHLEDQWPAEVLRQRAGQIGAGGVTSGQRPCLVISRLDQPIQQVINEARRARLGIVIKPKGEKADVKGARLRQGMIRAIENDSRAVNARIWALERAVKCGRGYYRVLTEYSNDGDFDLDLVVAEIANQGSVYLDPYAGKPDGSDAEWGFITDDYPHQEFFRKFPDSKLSDPGLFETIGNLFPTWITDKIIRVAEYYYREYKERTLAYLDDPALPKPIQGFVDELPEDLQERIQDKKERAKLPNLKLRKVQFPTVKHCFITAAEVLEETDWPGRFIPIVRVLGKRYNVEGEWSFQGVIYKAKDAQRSFNYMRSAQVEAVGLAPRANYIIDPKQILGYKQIWETANTHNWAYLPAHMFNEEGKPYPQPQRVFAEPEIQGITLAVREAETDIKATTGRSDPSLGVYSRDRSGKAIEQLKMQGELGSSNYLDALADSMNYEARVLLDLLPAVYDRPGRIVRLLGDDDDEKLAMVGQHFQRGPDGIPRTMPKPLPFQPRGLPPGMPPQMAGGPPMPGGMGGPPPMPMPQGGPPMGMPPGMPPGANGGGMPTPPNAPPIPQFSLPMGQPPQPKPPETEYYDLSEGDYTVTVTIGQSYPNQRAEDLDTFERLFQAMPAFTQVLGDLYLAQRDSPTMQKAADRLRKMNPHAQQEDGGQQIPPQVQAQMQQLQQENQQLKQLADDNIVKQKQIDAQMQMKQLEVQSHSQIELLKAKIEIQKLQGTTASKEKIAELQAETDIIETKLKIAAQTEQAEMERVEAERQVQRDDHAAMRDEMYAERADYRTMQREDRASQRDEQMSRRDREHEDEITERAERRAAVNEENTARRDLEFDGYREGYKQVNAGREADKDRKFQAREASLDRSTEAASAAAERGFTGREAEKDRKAAAAAAKKPPQRKK